MDYRSIRRSERLKRKGKNAEIVEKRTPVRVNYEKKRAMIVLAVLAAAVVAIGTAIVIFGGAELSLDSILPPAPTVAPTSASTPTRSDEEDNILTDGEGNPLPTVEAPNTYS